MEIDNKILESFKRNLKGFYKNSLSITVTDNKFTMLSYRKEKSHVFLRLNKMFLSAKEDVIEDIARYISGGKSLLINSFIRKNKPVLRASKPRKINITHAGDVYNLFDLFYEMNFKYFGGEVSSLITWGRKHSGRKRKRSIVFGAYYSMDNLIRINRMLDNKDVPDFFVKYIIYHEMLHTLVPTKRGVMHSREFKERERLFPDYDKAVSWQKSNKDIFFN